MGKWVGGGWIMMEILEPIYIVVWWECGSGNGMELEKRIGRIRRRTYPRASSRSNRLC